MSQLLPLPVPIFRQVGIPPYVPIKEMSMKITRTAGASLTQNPSSTQKDCSEGRLLDSGQERMNYKHWAWSWWVPPPHKEERFPVNQRGWWWAHRERVGAVSVNWFGDIRKSAQPEITGLASSRCPEELSQWNLLNWWPPVTQNPSGLLWSGFSISFPWSCLLSDLTNPSLTLPSTELIPLPIVLDPEPLGDTYLLRLWVLFPSTTKFIMTQADTTSTRNKPCTRLDTYPWSLEVTGTTPGLCFFHF